MNETTKVLEPASAQRLLMSTVSAMVIAGVLLVGVVLPAEYKIDPIGIGARLGILGMSAADKDADEEVTSLEPAVSTASSDAPALSALNAVWRQDAPFRNDQLALTLGPNQGAEIKAAMHAGERFVFTWQADGGVVNFDMHGEETGAKSDEYTSYWKGRDARNGHGEFIAPFDGIHGWYWRNRGTTTVTVTVKTSGFYERLFRP